MNILELSNLITSNTPITGDNSNTMMYIMLLLAAIIVVTALIIVSKKMSISKDNSSI